MQLNRYMEGHNGYIAGGAFKNIFNKEKVKDVDIFFRNATDFEHAKGCFFGDSRFHLKYETERSTGFVDKERGVVVDLVSKHFGGPEEMIKRFDFTITKCAYFVDTDGEWKVVYHKDFFEHLHFRKLVIEHDEPLEFPISTFERSYRYARKGYGLCKESKIILVDAIRATTTTDVSGDLYFGFD